MTSALLLQIALAVGAGLLLNLTPCVLPAIPLKVRAVLHEAGSRLPVRALAAALFLAGSVLFFAPLGLASALLQWKWGVLFQSRALLIALSMLLAALAVASFLNRSLPLPSAVAGLRGRRLLDPFISGFTCALLSTPCTGPLLGGVLVFSLAQPAGHVALIFMAIGVGLAAPYVLLLLRPGLLGRLPRAGAWSRVIQQSFGWLLLAAALFYAQSVLPDSWVAPLWIALFVAALGWSAFEFLRAAGNRAVRVAALSAGAITLALGYLGAGPDLLGRDTVAWQPLRAAGVAALPKLGRPAMVEFTADWCINCKVLEKTIYEDPAVLHALDTGRVVPLQADLTRPSPALEQLLGSYGGVGLPFVAVLNRDGRVVQTFSGLFTSASLVRALQGATPSGGSS